jgi:hypothetical protein
MASARPDRLLQVEMPMLRKAGREADRRHLVEVVPNLRELAREAEGDRRGKMAVFMAARDREIRGRALLGAAQTASSSYRIITLEGVKKWRVEWK